MRHINDYTHYVRLSKESKIFEGKTIIDEFREIFYELEDIGYEVNISLTNDYVLPGVEFPYKGI